MSKQSEEVIQYFSVEDLTETQLEEIRELCAQVYSSPAGKQNITYSFILAFVLWLGKQDKPFMLPQIEVPDKELTH